VLSLRKRKNHSLLGGNQDARHVKTAISLLGLFLLMHSLAFGVDLFQWTDARGVIHFTDSFDSVPELVRQSASLIVRPGFFSPADQSKSRPSFPERLSATRPPEPNQDSQLIANDIGPRSYDLRTARNHRRGELRRTTTGETVMVCWQ
jgi:hypothetical protein